MPNTLAHLGAQTLATRMVIRRADLKWIFAGAVIPDVPWIVGRATSALVPGFHGHELWAYLIVQSSLALSLVLCGVLALLGASPRRAFAILSLNATLHLVLDGLQDKWGSGVHLFAPASWRPWNAGWFAIDSWLTYALTALGLGVALWGLWRSRGAEISLAPTTRRLALATALCTVYVLAPIVLRHGPMSADTNSVGTLADRAQRAGRDVQFDRVSYLARPHGHYLRTYAGEELPLTARILERSAIVSARATFADDSTLIIHELHDHTGWPRDFMNYAGLALVAAAWILSLIQGRGFVA